MALVTVSAIFLRWLPVHGLPILLLFTVAAGAAAGIYFTQRRRYRASSSGIARENVDADITAVLKGLKDFSPKPWPQRFRELQAAGGRIEISKARVQQREVIAIANGALGLSPAGRLDGQLRLTVANLDKLLPVLGLDKMLSEQQAPERLNKTFGALDRIMPGLGNVARQNAGPAIVAGINLMGKPTELEGKRAVALPLRFDDGMASLGPLKLGMTPPLF